LNRVQKFCLPDVQVQSLKLTAIAWSPFGALIVALMNTPDAV
jgi:hypothetical protein